MMAIKWYPRVTVEKYSPDQSAWAQRRLHGELSWGRRLLVETLGIRVPRLHGDWLRETFGEPEDGYAYCQGNSLVNGGLDALAGLVINAGGKQPLANANAICGVGANAAGFAATQAALSGDGSTTTAWYQVMDTGYPAVDGTMHGQLDGQSTFISTSANFNWVEWCVPEDMEILTSRGWKHHDELLIGEPVLTLNPETLTSRWSPLHDIAVWPARTRRMRVLDCRNFHSVSTADHRWPVLASFGRDRRRQFAWRTSETLRDSDQLIRAVPHAGFPADPKYTDSLVRLIAHYWCDGWRTERHDRPSLRGGMGASREDKVASMRQALRSLPPGSWGENYRASDGATLFHLNKEAMEVLEQIAPGKLPSYAFLCDLTEAQLRLFIDVCVELGDGGVDRRGGGSRYWTQTSKHGDAIGRFEFACALAGIPTNSHEVASSAGRFSDRQVSRVSLLTGQYAMPVGSGGDSWQDRDGLVWCPSTPPDATWLCRHQGSVYWTGNCWGSSTTAISSSTGGTLAALTAGTEVMFNRWTGTTLGVKGAGATWIFSSTVSFSYED